jgi:hypothetical protein
MHIIEHAVLAARRTGGKGIKAAKALPEGPLYQMII